MIIFISFEYFVPAFKAGGPIQSLDNMVSNFPDNNVQLFVYCSNTDLGGSLLNVPSDEWTQYNGNTKVYYASAYNCKTGITTKLLNEIKPDVIFINGIFSRCFSIQPLLYRGGSRKILSVRGMLHPGALSQKRLKKKIFLSLFKLRGLQRKCEFHATSSEEAQYIKNNFGNPTKTWVVPNFPKIIGYSKPFEKKRGKLKMLSIALISPMKNIKLVIDALKQCKSDVIYDIYGPVKDESYWLECQQSMLALPLNITVNYKGALEPEKVAEILSDYHVMIQASKSENFGHSIFEAFSAGRPVITSAFTPWNDLEKSKAGYNVDINDLGSLQNCIEDMAAFDNETYVQWTKQSYAYANGKVNIPAIKAGYIQMFGIGDAIS